VECRGSAEDELKRNDDGMEIPLHFKVARLAIRQGLVNFRERL
jgi:hypothetical protein